MRQRLLIAIVGTVVGALAVAALVAFVGIRRQELTTTRENLIDYGQRLVVNEQLENVASLLGLQNALGLEAVAVYEFRDPRTAKNDETSKVGLTPAFPAIDSGGEPLEAGGAPLTVTERILPADLIEIAEGRPVSGTVEARVFSLVPAGEQNGQIRALLLVTTVSNNARQVLYIIVFATGLALLIAIATATAFARRLSRPIIAVSKAQARIASGDLSVRMSDIAGSDYRSDEIGDLMRDLDRMAEALGRAQKQEQQFLLSVSHDLRTPLTSIRGFAEALADGDAPDPQRAAAIISNEARRLERLVRDLLEMAKLDARQFTLHPRRIDLTDLVTDAADGFLPAAEREGLTMSLTADEEIEATIDPDRLGQVLANLIENALKFAKSSVHVSLASTEWTRASSGGPNSPGIESKSETSTSAVQLRVADDGPGIADADLPHIFERLYTSDLRPTRQIGSGLGLAIVKELVDAMGGSISAETSTGGTVFIVTIPISVASEH